MSSTGRDESFASLFEQSSGAKGGQRRYRLGESVDVTIVAVTREAVFADLGGKQEGIFERPELSDADGNLRVEVGSKVASVVSGIDAATGQVRLQPTMIRRSEADTGVAFAAAAGAPGAGGSLLVEGARVKGKVTGIERYGVFVQIAGTSGRSGRGLVPTQESATPRGSDLKKHFTVGQEVEAKILNIDATGKIRLSIAALGADDEHKDFEAYRSGQTKAEAGAPRAGEGSAAGEVKAQAKAKKPEVRGFGTLGDLLPKIAPKASPKIAPKASPKASPKEEAPAVKQRVRVEGRAKR
jgi:small subunit ribosomal protein S1